MLVEILGNGRHRLVRQHDHALVSGSLASAWTGLDRREKSLSFELVLATALHDLAWRELDAAPAFDPEIRGPAPFYDVPLSDKLRAYRSGLDELSRIHPYAALLTSLHYASFPDAAEAERFQAHEADRRRGLRARLELGRDEEPALQADLDRLQLFDRLSLFLCLAGPEADPAGVPEWVERCRHLEAPGGGTFHLTWVDDGVLHADPFPFRSELDLRLPFRELPPGPYGGPEKLRTAWREAPDRTRRISLRPAPRLA